MRHSESGKSLKSRGILFTYTSVLGNIQMTERKRNMSYSVPKLPVSNGNSVYEMIIGRGQHKLPEKSKTALSTTNPIRMA